jgi:hypothetical protein
MKKTCIMLLITSMWLFCSCQMVSPVILQSPAAVEKSTGSVLPFKLGVDKISKKGKAELTDAGFTILGIYHFKAKMPRQDEKDYLTQSIADHLNDSRIFNVSYVSPYNPKNVDVKVSFSFEEYALTNNKFYANFINLPLIQLVTLLGVPQDRFSSDIKVKINLHTTGGKLIKSYDYASTNSEWVTLYRQPYANYMWYDSVFQKEFDKMMKFFYAKLKADKVQIVKAVKG